MNFKALWLLALVLLLVAGCGGDEKKQEPADLTDIAAESSGGELPVPVDGGGEVAAETAGGETAGGETATPELTPEVEPEPLLCLDDQVEGKAAFKLPGLEGPVEIVIDRWGVPHIFAANEHDLFVAQGFIVARYRFIQMHAMRKIASGLFSGAAAATAEDLSNDVYMRLVNLRGAAEEGWELLKGQDPKSAAMVEAFSEGVNHYIAAVNDKLVEKPLEWPLVGEITPWVPGDSMVMARLQSWDLSFGGRTDKVLNAERFAELIERHGEGDLAGIIMDLHPMAPVTDALVIPADRSGRGDARPDLANAMRHPWLQRLPRSYWEQVGKGLSEIPMHHRNRSVDGVGSNNWTVSGELAEGGHALVANDTHLALRNPAVFFELHMNTTRAGGDIDAAGVCFPGIPAVILGRNAHAAWGATVYYSDVTDVYVEAVTLGDKPTVLFEGKQVPVVKREESFRYAKPAAGCESWLNGFILGTEHKVVEEGKECVLTVKIWEVPHHGPVIPGSLIELGGGEASALTWKWTGFDPSNEVGMIYDYLRMQSPEEFFQALSQFGVGAMNWVYGDSQGRIAYSARNRIPVRKHIAEGLGADFPSFLPYPGDGCCEWIGDVPDDLLPQALNPTQGYIMSANGDALGHTLDGNPYNDESYQGYLFYPGFRAARVVELLEQKKAAGKLTLADMQAIQADHRSPLGAAFVPHILEAIAAAEAAKAGDDGSDPALAPFAGDDRLAAVGDRLEAWSFNAAAGALPESTPAERADSVATSIFNVWGVFVTQAILADKMETGYDMQWHVRFLFNLFKQPEMGFTWDPETNDSRLWDDTTTPEVESRHYIVLKALISALDFLADPGQVGPAAAGGFGTADMDQWNWGKLHTVTLRHALGGQTNIPAAADFPDGYPRPSDNFSVDAADVGWFDTDFTFGNGPAIRNVFTLDPAGPRADTVIPGGQDSAVLKPHYKDQFTLWATNQTHPLHGDVDSLVPDAEGCFVLQP